jgi:hypothetical protein
MNNSTEETLRRENTIRVVKLAREHDWTDHDIGALLHHFHAALISRFDGNDVYLGDGRLVGRLGVVSVSYDKEAWSAYLSTLSGVEVSR